LIFKPEGRCATYFRTCGPSVLAIVDYHVFFWGSYYPEFRGRVEPTTGKKKKQKNKKTFNFSIGGWRRAAMQFCNAVQSMASRPVVF